MLFKWISNLRWQRYVRFSRVGCCYVQFTRPLSTKYSSIICKVKFMSTLNFYKIQLITTSFLLPSLEKWWMIRGNQFDLFVHYFIVL